MTGPHVRVQLSRVPGGNHVWVDDVDIRNVVTAVRIEYSAGGPATVSLELYGAEVIADGDLIQAAAPAETELRLMVRNGDPEVATLIRKMIRSGEITLGPGGVA